MSPSPIIALFIPLLIAQFFVPGSGIKCYDCNSNKDPECANEKPPSQFEKDCSGLKGHNFTLCRKVVQTIEHEVNGLKPDWRVVRSCGWDSSTHLNKCYQRSGFGGRQEVCSCTTDLCNAAVPGAPTATSIVAITATAFFLVLRPFFL